MIGIVIAFLVGGVIGFAGGFLFFRNNQDKLNQLEKDVDEVVDAAENAVKNASE